jgi:hypothetical protein
VTADGSVNGHHCQPASDSGGVMPPRIGPGSRVFILNLKTENPPIGLTRNVKPAATGRAEPVWEGTASQKVSHYLDS